MPKFQNTGKKKIKSEVIVLDTNIWISYLLSRKFHVLTSKSDILTDKKDNYLIDLYVSSGATMLVTGDKQLLEQASVFGLNVLTLKQFEAQIL